MNYVIIGIVLLSITLIAVSETMGYDATTYVSRKFIDLLELISFWR
ncbi:MAG: hypothetical protein HKN63_10255 [Rhodobacteraceae bacterium]|nr:hypothetical protein [Paracoccaceae bacterium]